MTGFVYYNEWDKGAAAWLRELIKIGAIADGVVDERSITDISANDIRKFRQCHFFAGIGGWSYALRLAGVGDNVPLWTASLPCQPFSAAGLGRGKDDERHLLPHFLELVRQCQPHRIFGEQVEGAIRHGWLDDLQTTMEAENYTVGHCVLGAHSVGSFHQRQRFYWVADSNQQRQSGQGQMGQSANTAKDCDREINVGNGGDGGENIGLADSKHIASIERCESAMQRGRKNYAEQIGMGGCMDDTEGQRWNDRNSKHIRKTDGAPIRGSEERTDSSREFEGNGSPRIISEWSNPDWLYCRDNKYRPIKPGIKPLVDGIPRGMGRGSDKCSPNETQEARVMRLKGYGNAIVPQVAAEFIAAFMEVVE